MKTITYNPETHALVPREPTKEMNKAAAFNYSSDEYTGFTSMYKAMLAAAPQPEPVESEPVIIEEPDYHFEAMGCGLEDRNITDRYEAMHYGWDCAISRMFEQIPDEPLYTTPQPEPVESEPAMWVMKHIRSGDLAQAKPNQKALHPYMWSDAFPLYYTTPQPDRTAELEAALKVARDGIDKFLVANDPTEFGCACDLSVGYLCGPCHADMQQEPLKIALAKINEVLK